MPETKQLVRESSPGWINIETVFPSRLFPCLIINSKFLFHNRKKGIILVMRRPGTNPPLCCPLFPHCKMKSWDGNISNFSSWPKISIEFDGNLSHGLHTLGLRKSALLSHGHSHWCFYSGWFSLPRVICQPLPSSVVVSDHEEHPCLPLFRYLESGPCAQMHNHCLEALCPSLWWRSYLTL